MDRRRGAVYVWSGPASEEETIEWWWRINWGVVREKVEGLLSPDRADREGKSEGEESC